MRLVIHATIARNECDKAWMISHFAFTHESGHDITDTSVKLDFSRVDNVIGQSSRTCILKKKPGSDCLGFIRKPFRSFCLQLPLLCSNFAFLISTINTPF